MRDNRYKIKVSKRYRGRPPALGHSHTTERFESFEDLEAYQVAREFPNAMSGVSLRLPDFEKFELAGQIRRAAVSLTNNISEGQRRYHHRDRIKFWLQARGPLEELIDSRNVCFDEKYMASAEIEVIKQPGWRRLNVINEYGRYLRHKKAAAPTSALQDAPSETLLGDEDDPFADVPL